LEASQEEASEWQNNAVEAAADATELRNQVATIERERSELETTAAAMEQEAAELRTRAESAVADADDLRGQAEALEQTVSRIRIELARAQDAANLANMRVARLASLAADQPQAMGVSLWNGSTQQGVLLVENLPVLPADKTYQFWVIDPSTSAPVSAGIFATDSAGRGRIVFRPSSNIRTAAQFAISVEPPGGSQEEGPSGPVVMTGETTSL
jgi:anti-sigma-K factor RskA